MQKTYTLNVIKTAGKFPGQVFQAVGAGYLPLALRADYQEQLTRLVQDCKVPRLRAHAHFHDHLGLISRSGKKMSFNFRELDKIYDFFIKLNLKPIIGLNFPDKYLVTGKETIFKWKGNVSCPDFNRWQTFLKAYLLHLKKRYGLKQLRGWYFEIWNEPQLNEFFKGKKTDYFKLYKLSARLIKKILPGTMVGGPNGNGPFVIDFIRYCARCKIPLDFISLHLFAVDCAKDKDGNWLNRLVPDQNVMLEEVQTVRRALEKYKLTNTKVIASELNSSWGPRDPIHDTVFNAVYLLDQYKRLAPHTDLLSYWAFSDLMRENGIPPSPFYGGFGLMSEQGIKKPVYHVFKYLTKMRGLQLSLPDDYPVIAVKNKNNLEVFCWHLKIPALGKNFNQTWFNKTKPDSEIHHLRLIFENLTGKYKVEKFVLKNGKNDPFFNFQEMGRPINLTSRQLSKLLKSGEGRMEKTALRRLPKALALDLQLSDNGLAYLKLVKLS